MTPIESPHHFPRPIMEFLLIKAECEAAIIRAMEKTGAVNVQSRLTFMTTVARTGCVGDESRIARRE
jgi:hypothetical protein